MTASTHNGRQNTGPSPAVGFPLRKFLHLLHRLRLADAKSGRKIFLFLAAIYGLVILNTYGQVRLNIWQGAFYNALDIHDYPAFLNQLGVFFTIVAGLLVLVVVQTWLTETARVLARGWLTRHLLSIWLAPGRAYLLGFTGDIARNPDQQITQDASRLTELSIGFVIGIGQAGLLLASFIGVLWGLSASIVFHYQGHSFSIPGYMVWCALAFSGTGSLLTWLLGRPLVPRNAERYAREGELRSQLVRVNDNVGAISIERGESGELQESERNLGRLLLSLQRIVNAHARVTWVTSGYGWLGLVFPIIVAMPGYFSGTMTLGSLMMVVGGFNQVQNSLRWFIDNYASIAEWQAVLNRVTGLIDKIDEAAGSNQDGSRINYATGEPDCVTIEDLAVSLPGDLTKCILINGPLMKIKKGEWVLVAGKQGSGRTTLFMALAGLWPWGCGTIRFPKPFNALFLSERPYVPPGTLLQALAYPAHGRSLKAADAEQALRDAGLGDLAGELSVQNNWDRELSMGEQQRLGIARLLLRAPDWAFLDNCLSALDDEDGAEVLQTIKHKLPAMGVMSMSRTEGRESFYGRVIRLGGPADLPSLAPPDAVAANSSG